jgi:4-diphosphocytidyl-2C-methyl-D-erythritol kinase
MYAALRAEHMGPATARDDPFYNTFELVLADIDPEAAGLLERAAAITGLTPHLCGSGPAFFFLVEETGSATAVRGLERLGVRALATCTVTAAEATAISIDG